MPQRQFKDPDARHWTVWDVRPERVERELERQRPARPLDDERRAADRPMQARGGADADGWLCFEAQDVKRRLTPIPSGWWRLTDEELACLCERAAAVDRKPASSPSETAPRDA